MKSGSFKMSLHIFFDIQQFFTQIIGGIFHLSFHELFYNFIFINLNCFLNYLYIINLIIFCKIKPMTFVLLCCLLIVNKKHIWNMSTFPHLIKVILKEHSYIVLLYNVIPYQLIDYKHIDYSKNIQLLPI